MTAGGAPATARPRARRSSVGRWVLAGTLCGLLTAGAAAAVILLSGPPLCRTQDNGFGCLGTTAGLSVGSLVLLVPAWAALWWWAGSRWPWAVALRGLPLVLGAVVVLVAGTLADGLQAVSFSFTAAEDDLRTAVLLLLWLAVGSAAALAGAALWVARRRRRAVLLVPALLVALVGADALAAVGVLGYQTWRVRSVAPHPYGLVGPAVTLVDTRVEHGALLLGYRSAQGQDVEVTVQRRPAGIDLTAACSPEVVTAAGERVKACEASDAAVPGGFAWASSGDPVAGQPPALVVVEPDAVIRLAPDGSGVLPADLVPLLRRTGAVTLLRSTEETVEVS